MANPCFYHPQVSAVGNCIGCGTPGCGECLEDVGGKMACPRCIATLKSRPTTQTASAPAPPPPAPSANVHYGPAHGYDPALGITAPPRRNYIAEAAAAEASVPQSVHTARLLMGLGVAGAVGLLGALGIEKIAFSINYDITVLYIVLAAVVAYSLRGFTGRSGVTTAFLATAVMVASLGLAHWLFVQDFVNKMGTNVSVSEAFPVVMSHLTGTHWMLVLCSVIACFVFGYRK